MRAPHRTGGLLLAASLLSIAPASPAAAPGAGAFVDRAAEWGLAFRYSNGATGKLYYPEIVGGGVALLDYDGDGDLDVFVVQGKVLEPGAAAAHPIVPAGGRLFRNDLIENGVRHAAPRFVDVTAASGIRADGYGMGVAVGDFDGDGRPDLYLLNYGPNQLWRNNGDGTFTEVARAAGADGRPAGYPAGHPNMSLSASFADLDRDGWLDLYVADYVEFDVARNIHCSAASSRPDYCGPSAFPPAPHRLLRNRGDGTFEDVSLPSGIARSSGRGMGVVAADFDGDGWPDLFVANDGTANFLFRNLGSRGGGFRFEEVALPAGAAVDGDGRVKANMGIAAGDVDDDGDWDLFVTHIAGEGHTLWVNDGGGTFEDRTAAAGLAATSLPATGFGTGFLDYDNDGRLDLLAVDGAVRTIDEQARRGDPFPFAERPQMWRNLGGGRFAEVSAEMGESFRRAGVSRGAAFGDVDNDGDTDVVVVDANGPVRLLVNEVGSRRPWLGLRLVGPSPPARGAKTGGGRKPAERDMLGAKVGVVRRGASTLWRRAATDGSYASASDPRVLVGLGDAADVVELRVYWPDGRAEVFPPPPLRAYTTIHQGTGRPLAAPARTAASLVPRKELLTDRASSPVRYASLPPGRGRVGEGGRTGGGRVRLASWHRPPPNLPPDPTAARPGGRNTVVPTSAGAPEQPTVVHPDLAPLERGVAEQLAAGGSRLAARRADPAASPAALAAAYGELGVLYHAYALAEPAEACYENAARLAPSDPRWPHDLGVLLQEAGRLDEAAAAYDRALALAPGDLAALLHLGEIRRQQGRPADAEAVLRRALAADPASPAAKSLLGQALLDLRRPREAAELLEAALAQAPDAARIHYPLAQAYRALGQPARAAEHLARAGQVGLRPADPLVDELASVRTGERVHLARGKTAFNAGRYAEAAAELRRALAARPESVPARVDLAAALARLGDAPAAADELRRALQLDPGNATAHFNLGTLLAAAGPSEEAREHLAAAARAMPEDAGAHRALAHLLRESGRLDDALPEYARAVALAPADDLARLEAAETLVRLGRYGEARRALEEGVRALPASGLLAHGLARLLAACPDLALRDGARARDLAAAVWQARPTPEHAETLALAEAELGRCDEAARWQRAALEALASAPAAPAREAALRARLAHYERGAPCRPE